mgnify:CR=1 FL=1
MGFNYYNQIHLGSEWIDKHLPMFETLIMETIDADVHLQTMIRKLKMFFCYCDAANLNWYIVADETMLIARPELRKWIHRFLGRLIGISFLVPLIYYTYRTSFKTLYKLYLIFFLICFQGFIGWYMVSSGLLIEVMLVIIYMPV